MALLEVGLGQMVHVNETADPAEASMRAGDQFEHQLRGIADRSRDIGEDHEIDMARPARAKVEIDKSAAALDCRANRAPEVDSAGPRQAQPPAQSNPEAPNQRRQSLARFVVVEVGKFLEGHPLDCPDARDTSRIDPALFRFC